ncbi:hypothetical protein TNCV_1667691 [Trichonephila clavipes]|nr:hypothetical protein TNCV_1667691 [Trichonephila clavipes]
MAKFSYLPENKRYKIIHLKEEGYSMRQIAAKVPCGLSTVWYWARTRDKASHDPIPIPLGYRGISYGVGRLHIVSGTVKAMDYIEILQNKLLPTARDLLGNQSWIFQGDNAPCHRAKVVQKG